jgi:glucuronoarabinoxylan endo-1,4-beta-xylanase
VYAQAPVTITWSTTYQPFDGMGASTGSFNHSLPCNNSGDFGPSMTAARAQVLFGTGQGQAGLNLMRLFVCPDGTYPDNPAALEALAANPNVKVWASPATPPLSYTANKTLWNGANCLLPADYQNYANYLTAWVKHEETAGIPIYMLSVQNEPDYTTPGNQGVCGWNGTQFRDFIVNNLGPTFAAAGVSTKIALAETSSWDHLSSYAGPCLADSQCVKYVGFVTSHIYSGTIAPYPAATNAGLHVWETEIFRGSTFDGSMTDALHWALQIHQFFTVANASAWHYWLLLGNFGDNEPLDNIQSGDSYASRLWVMGNWSKFVPMGAVRIDAPANPDPGVYITAFRRDATGEFAIVAINSNASASPQVFSLAGFPNVTTVTPTVTSATANLQDQAPINVSSGTFSYTLPAQSVVTLHGRASIGGPTGSSIPPAPPTGLTAAVKG